MPRHALVLGLLLALPRGAVAHDVADPTVLVQEGSTDLADGRYGDALRAFTRAFDALPGDPSPCVGAGLAAYMLGRNDEARAWFERALARSPRNLVAAEWLGRLQHGAGRLEEAIATYDAALSFAPGAPRLAARVAVWRKELDHQRQLQEWRGAHFSVRFRDLVDEPLARRTGERLEVAYQRIGQALGVYPSKSITVVLYTGDDYRDVTRLPSWTAAAYDGRILVPLSDGLDEDDELDRVLGHEFVHVIVALLGGRAVPAWLNEGLATVLERGGREEAESVLAGAAVLPPLSRLHGSFEALSTDDARVAYAVSTMAVGRIIDLRSAGDVVALLKDLARGVPFDAAFQRRIGLSYGDFQTLMARD